MDLGNLTPEEKAAILEAAQVLQNEPEDPIKVIASALELVMAKLEAVEEKVDGVCDTVYNQFIGGINDLAAEKAHADRIGGLKTQYGSLFGGPGIPEYLDAEGYGGDKLFELLDEHISKLKGEEGFDESTFNEEDVIKNIASTIGERVAKITGKPVVAQADGGPAEVIEPKESEKPAEEAPKEEPKEEEDPYKGLKEHIGKLKDRGGQAA